MKILKNILKAIMALIILLCGFILLCAVKPEITEKLSDLISREDKKETLGGAIDGEDIIIPPVNINMVTPEEGAGYGEDTDENAAESEPAHNETENTGSNGNTSVMIPPADYGEDNSNKGPWVKRGLNGYEPPMEAAVRTPDAVAGKAGYKPVTEKSEALPGASGGEYTSKLGYGETGDGLTFDPVIYPYYQMLDPKGQHIYRQIYANAMAMNPAFVPIEAVPVDNIKNVLEAVYNDHPELFWLNTIFTCRYDDNKICAELELEFNMTEEELATARYKFGNRANEILTQVQNVGSDFERELKLHDLLIEQIEYDKGADKNQSAYSALVDGKTVCAGYARAMQYLMQRMGIPCYYCTGYVGQDHAWNIVRLDDGGFYNVDVTWDDTPDGEHDYFNKTDDDYAKTHVRRSMSIDLPQCEGQKYRYIKE